MDNLKFKMSNVLSKIRPENSENFKNYLLEFNLEKLRKDMALFILQENDNDFYDVYEADTFIDKVELDNNKLTLKCGLQYKMPEQKITIGLNLDYTKAVDNLKTEQEDPVFKAKLAIKYGF